MTEPDPREETYEQQMGVRQPKPVSEHGQQFLDALTHLARSHFHPTATAGAALRRALSNGWAPTALAEECCRDLDSAANPGAVIQHRLDACGTAKPARKLAVFAQPKPWCGDCSDDAARWRLNTETAVRCDCWTDPKGTT